MGAFDTQSGTDVLTSWIVNHQWREVIADALLILTTDGIYEGTDSEVLDVTTEATRLIAALYGQVDTMALGTIWWYAADGAIPLGWLLCDGTVYDIADYPDLGALFGAKYGGDGTDTFAVPDLIDHFIRGADTNVGDVDGQDEVTLSVAQLPSHTHTYTQPTFGVDIESVGVPDPSGVGNPPVELNTGATGGGEPVETIPTHMRLRPIVKAVTTGVLMVTPQPQEVFVVGEIRWLAVSPAAIPNGWGYCNGGAFDVGDFPELFDAIGYSYGGSGEFALLPDLVSRFAIGATEAGDGQVAETGGSATHTLSLSEIPTHTHDVTDYNNTGGVADGPVRTLNGSSGVARATSSVGSSSAHNNLPPYLALTPVIRLIP